MQSLAQKQPTRHREKVTSSTIANRVQTRLKSSTNVKPSMFDIGKDGDSKVKKVIRKPLSKENSDINDIGTAELCKNGVRRELTEAGEQLNFNVSKLGQANTKQDFFSEKLENLNAVLASTALSSVYIPPLRRVNATYFGDEPSLQSSPELCSSISQNADVSICLSEARQRIKCHYQNIEQPKMSTETPATIDMEIKQDKYESILPLDANNAGVATLSEQKEVLKAPKSFSRRVIGAFLTLKTKRSILPRKKSKEKPTLLKENPSNEESVPGSEMNSIDSSSVVTAPQQCWSTTTQADKPDLREIVTEMRGITSPAFTAELMNNFCDSTDWGKYPGIETECGLAHYPAMLNTMSNSNDSGKNKMADSCTKATVLLATNYRPGTDLFHQFEKERRLRRTD